MSSSLVISEPLQRVTNASEIPQFARIVAAGFSEDCLNRYLQLGPDANPNHPKLQKADQRAKYWETIIQPRFDDGALLVHSHDWAAVALWFPPGVEKQTPPQSVLSEGITEYLTFFKALRGECLGNRPHWHLNIISRDPARNDKGAITAIIDPILAEAKAQNLPIWLESTNAHATGVYQHFGFKIVGETRIGKGRVGNDGWSNKEGDGVQVWGMIAGMDD